VTFISSEQGTTLFEALQLGLIHRDYVRPLRLPVDMGRILSTLCDLRSVGDDGGAAHVSHAEANVALIEAQQFLEGVRSLLPAAIFDVVGDREASPDMGDQQRSWEARRWKARIRGTSHREKRQVRII
jgi:hypothetical protein